MSQDLRSQEIKNPIDVAEVRYLRFNEAAQANKLHSTSSNDCMKSGSDRSMVFQEITIL